MSQNLDKAKHHYQLAKLAHQQRDFHEAAQHYLEVLSYLPDEASILCNLAHCYFELQEFFKAGQAYEAYLKQDMDTDVLLNLAICYERQHYFEQAEAAYKQLLNLCPDHFEAYFNLGVCQLSQAKREQAQHYFTQALRLKPDDHRVQFHLSALTDQEVERAPNEYVSKLFDQYADHFDQHLNALEYQVPSALYRLIEDKLRLQPHILDLGCGTGLMAEQLTKWRPILTGIDLSPKMLAQAQHKNLYDSLYCEEVTAFLHKTATTAFDFILAADVFVYIGELAALFSALPKHIKPEGYLAFSVEAQTGDGGLPYRITTSGRFQHDTAYIKQLATSSGFRIIDRQSMTGRQQAGKPVETTLFCLQKTTHST